jgi:hypothetical protein
MMMTEPRMRSLGVVLLALLVASSHADQVFTCRDASGKVTFSNVPCSGQANPPPADSGTSNYSTFYGEWRGQAQIKETVAGQTGNTAHSVAALTLMIDPGGKVTGSSEESGCRVLGVAGPGPVATVPGLDVTLSAWKEPLFNRRYTGSLALYPQERYATLQLLSPPMSPFGKIASYEITATLRR